MKFSTLLAAGVIALSASLATAGTLDTLVVDPIPVVDAPAGGSIGSGAGVALVVLGLAAIAIASGNN